MDKFKHALPWIALAAVAAVALMSLMSQQRIIITDENPENHLTVVQSLEQTVAVEPQSLEDPDFRSAVQSLVGQGVINNTWIFDLDGSILYGSARYANSGNVRDFLIIDTVRLIESMPDGSLTQEQETALLAISVMRVEGEHNDVFRHMLMEVHSPDGSLLGWIGAAYDANDLADLPNTTFMLEFIAFLVCMGIYWLALPVWTWLDARRRGEKAIIWAIFVLLGNLVALIAYLLVRSKPVEK